MAGKEMVYEGTAPLEVVLPDSGEVVEVAKGDVVDYAGYGGAAFFEGRTDFAPKTTKARKGSKADG